MSDDTDNDPMAVVDLAVTFTAPIVHAHRTFTEAGFNPELVNHIVLDFSHFIVSTLHAQIGQSD